MEVLKKSQIIVVCKSCGSTLSVEPSDIEKSTTYHDVTYIHCPLCNGFNFIKNQYGRIEDNVRFKKAKNKFFQFF